MTDENENNPQRMAKRAQARPIRLQPVQYETDQPLPTGSLLPARVIYTTGGTLIPALPDDPDLPKALTVRFNGTEKGRLPNGMTPRSDLMARLMARGVGATPAYRVAYKSSSEPIRAAMNAWRVNRTAKFRKTLAEYRTVLERESRQQALGIKDFVLGRLTVEAQESKSPAARTRALELLGKTEGMFTTVHRTEKAMTPKDMEHLKAQLYQRLRDAMAKAGHGRTTYEEMPGNIYYGKSNPIGGKAGGAEPHPPGSPLISSGSHPGTGDTIPLIQTPLPTAPGGVSPEGPVEIVRRGVFHREMSEDDL